MLFNLFLPFTKRSFPMSDLFDDFPHFNNLHTSTLALGLAVAGSTVFYLSTAGPGTACKSIWGSLVSASGKLDAGEWGSDLAGAPKLHTEYKALGGSNFQHMVSFVRSNQFLVVADPSAAQFYSEVELDHVEGRKKLLAEHIHSVYATFIARLNAQTDVPLLPGWALALWAAGLAEGAIISLETYGDCLGAWLLKDDFVWLPVVQRMLTWGQLHITSPQAKADRLR
jgi:hypothetical protein